MTIHILPNISRRKGNQSMKFGQIVECNTRSIFSNIIHKMWWEISLKKQNLAYLGINSLKFYSLFLLYVQGEGSRIIWKLRCRPLAFTSDNVFLKNKKRSGTNIPFISCTTIETRPNFTVFYFTSWDIGQNMQCNFVSQVVTS